MTCDLYYDEKIHIEIDILRNSSPKKLDDLKGYLLGLRKVSKRLPNALLARTMYIHCKPC